MSYEEYRIHSATSSVVANGLFQLQTDASRFDGFTNVLGFYLDAWGDKPLSDEQLLNIAKNAASIARRLLDESVYSGVRYYGLDGGPTGRLKDSIHADTRDGSVNVYSDARAPNGYPYAGSIEYGFHPWGHSHFVQPRPFLRPALEYAITATRAGWRANVDAMVEALRTNELALSHFNYKTDVGASRRNWGQNIAARTSSTSIGRMRAAIQAGRSRGNYSHEVNRERYGTEKGAYRSVWDVDRGYRG